MSTALENQLVAALRARAELVGPEDLQHLTLPLPAPQRWRRPAVMALVAAAAAVVVAVAVPLVLKAEQRSDRAGPTGSIPTPVTALTGDVDGDGESDRVEILHGQLRVTLAADPSHTRVANLSNSSDVGLVGLADVGGPGQGIVVAGPGGRFARTGWSVYALRDGGLGPVYLSASRAQVQEPTLGQIPGRLVSWITTTGELMSGLLDPAQQGEQQLSVTVRRYVPLRGRLRQERVGQWCWDTATQPVPAPCTGDQVH
jgi:hypothetical protein